LNIVQENRNILKSFYGILKPSDEHLEFVLLTGVSKFAKVSRATVRIFSDLNNLNDISLDEGFANVVGISQADLEKYFAAEIKVLSIEKEMTRAVLLQKIKQWYNGYSWNGKYKVYNPFSLLNFFLKKEVFRIIGSVRAHPLG